MPGIALPTPSTRQQTWHQLELYGFLHFTVNTFTDQEWGYGDESPAVFNPTDFDADQLVSTAKAGGLKGLILTCKHHDGFCLWPSAYTEHSVKNSPWRGGKGDVVREVSNACLRHGLQFGVYLSPWDRNHAAYGTPAYLDYYRSQLKELLGNYGPIFEVWFDGANGGDGYYGGARETRLIDKTSYYDWENTWKIVRELQPDACIFSDAGPDIRWVGNEDGIAGDPCWATLTTEGLAPGLADAALLNTGQREGAAWLPAECDVSIRPGWFYHASEDTRVKTPAELLDLYERSVGRGASLLINLPPDRRGRIHENDAAALRGFYELLSAAYQTDLAAAASARSMEGTDYTLEFENPIRFNRASLRESISLGQRIDAFTLEAWINEAWVELARGQSIGSRRLLRFPTATTQRMRVRLSVLQSAAPPALSEFALYHAAE